MCVNAVVVYLLAAFVVIWCDVICRVCQRCCGVLAGGLHVQACSNARFVCQRCCVVLAGSLCGVACCNIWCVSTLLWCIGWRLVCFGVLQYLMCVNAIAMFRLAACVFWRVVIFGVCVRYCGVLAGVSCCLALCNLRCLSVWSRCVLLALSWLRAFYNLVFMLSVFFVLAW